MVAIPVTDIACPVCNKLLVLLIGGAMLLEYYEPVRRYAALGGAAFVAVAPLLKLARLKCFKAAAPAAGATLSQASWKRIT